MICRVGAARALVVTSALTPTHALPRPAQFGCCMTRMRKTEDIEMMKYLAEKQNSKLTILKPAAAATVAAFAVATVPAVAIGDEARQETSDRTPAKDTKEPLSQVDAVDGETSDRTPGSETADAPETSDRTPGKDTETPAAQVGKFKDETSDRTPSND